MTPNREGDNLDDDHLILIKRIALDYIAKELDKQRRERILEDQGFPPKKIRVNPGKLLF